MKSSFENVVYFFDTDVHITLDEYRDKNITTSARIGILERGIIIHFSAGDTESQNFMVSCSHVIQKNPYVDMIINGSIVRGFLLYTDTVFGKNHDVYIKTVVNKLEINMADGLCTYAVLKFEKNVGMNNILKFTTLANYDFDLNGENEFNTIRIKKSDDSSVETSEMVLFLNQIRYFMSFFNGKFITPTSTELFNKDNERIFIQLFPSTQSSTKHSVLTTEMLSRLPNLFEKFLSICDFESLKRVISMYITVNSNHNIDLISSIIIAKTAIEVLIDKIAAPSFSSESEWSKDSSFNKIDKYLSNISANVFFDSAKELHTLAATINNYSTPFALVNRIRNDLVHPKQTVIPDMDRSAILLMETHTILLLFFEKIVLNLLEYHGTYLQRAISPMLVKEIRLP